MSTNPTVLLVDDDPELLRLLSMRLHAAGFNARTALSGEQALAFIGASRPQVVITDLRMEGLDGMTLFHRIHQMDPDLPVIVLTAHGTIPDAVDATRRGVFGFLTKPYEAPELIALVKRAIARFTLDQLNEYLQKLMSQDIAAQQAEIKRLQHLDPIGASDRLKLACLLSLENASWEDLVQARTLLDELEPLFGDPGTRLYVRLLQRAVMLETACQREKQRIAELEEMLSRIKGNDPDLMQGSQTTALPQSENQTK
ncbi:MAG TPA: response regulator [Thiobacillaceae bacterium]|nr:response regulator [Thiobacillaceae bacterium]